MNQNNQKIYVAQTALAKSLTEFNRSLVEAYGHSLKPDAKLVDLFSLNENGEFIPKITSTLHGNHGNPQILEGCWD